MDIGNAGDGSARSVSSGVLRGLVHRFEELGFLGGLSFV